jgi:tetratricopeptide (TPR) repeat protein
VEYFRKDDMGKARECFECSRDVCPGPGYAPTFNNLGVICQDNSQIDSAKTFYQKAIQLDDYNLAYQNLGRLLVMLNENKSAIAILENGKRLYPEDPEILYCLGIAYFQDQNIQNARQVLTDLEKILPGYKETRSLLQRLNW